MHRTYPKNTPARAMSGLSQSQGTTTSLYQEVRREGETPDMRESAIAQGVAALSPSRGVTPRSQCLGTASSAMPCEDGEITRNAGRDIFGIGSQPILQSVVIGAFLAAVWNTAVPQAPASASGAVFDYGVAQEAPAVVDPFANLRVEARSFLVFDLSSGASQAIAARESALQWPLASVTKLMTAIVAHENIPAGEEVKITTAAVSERGDDGLLVGERFLRDDLANLMLVRSSNDAARALADQLGFDRFLELMNDKAKALSMTQTYFLNTNGLDVSVSTSGAYSSAEDLAKLSAYILNTTPQILTATESPEFSVRSLSGKAHGYPNTNKLVDRLPQLIGGKTGLTDIAGGNLLVIVDIGINHPVGIVVLGSSEEGRFADVLALYDATLKYFSNSK